MLHTRLAAIDAKPLGRGEPWLIPGLLAAALASGAFLFWISGHLLVGALLAISTLIAGTLAGLALRQSAGPQASVAVAPDYSLVASALALSPDPAALTDREGQLVTANAAYRARFPGAPSPPNLGADDESTRSLNLARTLAWRDGEGGAESITTQSGPAAVEVQRVGARGDQLLWRFPRARPDLLAVLVQRIGGMEGEIFARSGVLAAATGSNGELLAANPLLRERAELPAELSSSMPFADLLTGTEDGRVRLGAEGDS